MRHIFSFLFLFSVLTTQVQDSILVKFNEQTNEALVVMPKDEHPILKTIVPFLPLISVLVAFIGLFGIGYQIRARRKDDILKNQLDRLNKQITEFYGPLHALYETGHQNYYAFLELYGHEFDFNNPHFKQWDIKIFQPTNLKMEDIIINKMDLIIGNTIPEFFFQFCEWLTAQKAYINAESQPDFDNESWRPIRDNYKHPEDEMRLYLKASFEVLKKTQGDVLSGSLKLINEKELMNKITKIKEEYIKDPETNKWEKSVWHKVELMERKAETIKKLEETMIKDSYIPKNWKNLNDK